MGRILIVCLGLAVAGAALAIWTLPSDRAHAAATTPEMLAAFADPAGRGALDGLHFETRMGPQGKPDDVEDFVKFDQGLFMSRECTDRCNFPPSAYLTRDTEDGTDFIVEAFCPTKNTTMVWRGTVRGDKVSGTVEWTSRRLLMSSKTMLVFEGTRSARVGQMNP